MGDEFIPPPPMPPPLRIEEERQKREIEADFLKWLGGYFDHGALCAVYQRTQLIKGKTYPFLDVQIMFTGTKEACTFIKDHYVSWSAKLRMRTPESWLVHFRAMPEVFKLATDLLPYSKFRQGDLKQVIEAIESWQKKDGPEKR